MTCIAAVTDGTTVAMAADSLAVGSNGTTVELTKLLVLEDGAVLLGVAGRAASIPLLRRSLVPGLPTGDDEPDDWAQDIAIEATRLLVDAGIVDRDDDRQFCGALLLAYGGLLWEIESGIAIPVRRRYHAVGSGDELAMGALFAIDQELPLIDQARLAVEAAAEHRVDVGGEVAVAST